MLFNKKITNCSKIVFIIFQFKLRIILIDFKKNFEKHIDEI